MKRRSFIGGGLGVLSLGAGGAFWYSGNAPMKQTTEITNEQESQPKQIPADIKGLKKIAVEFKKEINPYFENAHVYVTPRAEVVMEYDSKVSSSGELKTEFAQIAVEYGDLVAQNNKAATLTIVTGSVQGIVTKPAVKAYAEGDLEEEAFTRTIEVMGVDRTSE